MAESIALPTTTKPQGELETYLYRSTAALAALLLDLAAAYLNNDYDSVLEEREKLQAMIGDTMILADLLGRRRMLLEADAHRARNESGGTPWLLFANGAEEEVSPILPEIPFQAAIEDLITREPRLAPSADAVQNVYRTRHAFAVMRATDLAVTRKVQSILKTSIQKGLSEPKTADLIEDLTGWSRGYSQTVYRTNTNTAFNAGRFVQARDPDVSEVIGALKFVSANDEDTRPNHRAAHGLIASPSDPVWARVAPPLGYNAVLAGQIVTTWKNPRPIEKVRVGHKVMTAQGEWCDVYATDKDTKDVEVITVELENGMSVDVTEEHPVMTRRGWVPAGQLKQDDEVYASACAVCGKPINHAQNVCSYACNNKQRTVRHEHACAQCGEPTINKYCSHTCFGASCRGATPRPCETCGKNIEYKGKKRGKYFCSHQCAATARMVDNDRPCKTCGVSLRDVWKKKGARKGGWSLTRSRMFCSFRCWRRYNGETSIERVVREYLAAHNVAYVQREQIGRYEVDFILPQFGVIVECDGTYWHRPGTHAAENETRRDSILREKTGAVVVHLLETEIRDGSWVRKLYAVCRDQNTKAVAAAG